MASDGEEAGLAGLDLGLGLSITGGSATPFDPATLFTGAQSGGFYDPSDLTTLFQDSSATTPVTADGDPVARINDKSGNGNHLTLVGASGTRPLYKASGGLKWLQFDGVDDGLTGTFASNLVQPYDRVSAIRLDTWADNRYIFDGGTGDEGLLRQSGSTPQLGIYAGNALGGNGGATLGAAHVVHEHYEGASSALTVDATTVTGNAFGQTATGLTMGIRPGGAVPCPVKIFGVIVRDAFSAGELANAKAWAASKGGI